MNYLQYWNPERLNTDFGSLCYLTSSNQSILKNMQINEIVWLITRRNNSNEMLLAGKIEIARKAISKEEANVILKNDYYPYLQSTDINYKYDLEILNLNNYVFSKIGTIEHLKLENLLNVSLILREEFYNGNPIKPQNFQSIRKVHNSLNNRLLNLYNSICIGRSFY
ncbi:MAG: hypothetical protein NTW25_03815 [Candidatus Kapabacteria bacterium]|nr:hypothetical protein [Candidatus Kapabacteria bacterium]